MRKWSVVLTKGRASSKGRHQSSFHAALASSYLVWKGEEIDWYPGDTRPQEPSSRDAGLRSKASQPGRDLTWWFWFQEQFQFLGLPGWMLSSSHPLQCCGVWTQQPNGHSLMSPHGALKCRQHRWWGQPGEAAAAAHPRKGCKAEHSPFPCGHLGVLQTPIAPFSSL